MIQKNKILHRSWFVGIVGVLAGGVAFGAVRVGNMSRSEAYRQLNAQRAMAEQNVNQQQITTSQEVELPIPVANTDLAQQITDGTGKVGADDLESCARIYPNGEFAWDKPTAGIGAGGASTCVAVVELRALNQSSASIANPNAPQYVVVARANVAAGSNVRCNISDFPEISYTNDVQNVIFPADNEPTVQDVINVMNQEQKQNAALKIAAGALIGGIGGNIAGKNDAGKDGLIGTDKGKIQGTIIGALGGAAIGAGGSYLGKVGGDMVMSTGINAAAGGVVGNIMASGDSVLRVEKCSFGGVSRDCLWGVVSTGKELKDKDGKLCEMDADGEFTDKCIDAYLDLNDGTTVLTCENGSCKQDKLESIVVNGKSLESIKDIRQELNAIINGREGVFHLVRTGDGKDEMQSGIGGVELHTYGRITAAMRPESKRPAIIVDNIQDKVFGLKRDYWIDWKPKHMNVTIYGRYNGEPTDPIPGVTVNNFYPLYVDSEDGGIIDLDNKARAKSTAIGAGVGGAAGAFTAYQGAQSDIDERWVAAVREYKDSLQKFYCATGSRFLSYYNDPVVIPNMNE